MRLALISLLMIPLAVGCSGGSEEKPAAAPQAEAPPNKAQVIELDGFFDGIENGCGRNQILSKALSSAVPSTPYGKKVSQINAMDVPNHLKKTFAKPELTDDKDDYSAFTVQILNATYLGFPVTSLTRWQGKENGINGFSITVTGTPAAVGAKARSTLNVREDEDGFGYVMKFDALKDGNTSIGCDTSM